VALSLKPHRAPRAIVATSLALAAALAVTCPTSATRAEEAALPRPAAGTTAPVTPAVKDGEEGEPRLSLAVESDRDAWRRSGFRLGLGAVYGELRGLDGAPSGRLLGATIRVGLRLDADWSILASFQYASASSAGGLSGLRFAGTIDPTWHVTSHLSVAVGLGFGGIVEGGTNRPQIEPLPSTLGASYTFPHAGPPLPSCSGVGVAGLARVEWAIVLGPRSATAFGVEGLGQWTGCVDDSGVVEPDTGQSIVRRQWWPHLGVVGSWGVMWR
jgi:hypothetical protein